MTSTTGDFAARSNLKELLQDYETASALKIKGNKSFKEGNLQQALKCYSQIFLHIGMSSAASLPGFMKAFGIDDEDTKDSDEKADNAAKRKKEIQEITIKTNVLRISALNNMAMVYIKLQNWQKVIEKCDKVIKSYPLCFKALLRKARALRHLKQFKEAYDTLSIIQKKYPNDFQIKNEWELNKIKNSSTDDIIITHTEPKPQSVMSVVCNELKNPKSIAIAIVSLLIVFFAIYWQITRVTNANRDMTDATNISSLNATETVTNNSAILDTNATL